MVKSLECRTEKSYCSKRITKRHNSIVCIEVFDNKKSIALTLYVVVTLNEYILLLLASIYDVCTEGEGLNKYNKYVEQHYRGHR